MHTAGLSWKYYAPQQGEAGYSWSVLDAFSQIRKSSLWSQNVSHWTNFISDAKNNRLPAFSWLVAPAQYSEHPTASTCQGENWTVQQIDAVENSPEWSNTLIVVTWDDYGGFYDHVQPQHLDALGYGFRVPMLIISPYAYAPGNSANRHSDHSELEFASVLKLAEKVFNLPSLGKRDVSAGDLMSALDFSKVHDSKLILSTPNCP